MVNSNVATITLAGNEIKVEFESGYPYYQITNKGDTDIYVSEFPNITPEADGVYTVSAGGSEIIGEGYSFSVLYLLGTGKAYIRGKRNAMPASFKLHGKGGDPSGGCLKTKIVTALPEVGNIEYLYLVPKDDLLSNNIYDEYLWVDGKWELIGYTAIEVDLTDYAKKEDIPTIPVTVSDFSMEENYTSTGTQLHIGCRKNWSTGSHNVNEKFLVLNPATNTRAGLITAAEKKKLTSLLPPISEISDNPTGENVPTDLAVYNFCKGLETVTGIKGESETEYRTGNVNISQSDIGLIFDGGVLKNKTVGEAKEIISGAYLSNPDRFGIFMRVPSDLIEKWDDDYYVLSAGSVCQITPIGTVTKASNTGKLYGRFLITAYFGESPYIFDVSASAFGKINKILTSLDITPEMLQKLKNL